MTLRTFNKWYQVYKNNFDLEMRLRNSNTTYEELNQRINEDEEWF